MLNSKRIRKIIDHDKLDPRPVSEPHCFERAVVTVYISKYTRQCRAESGDMPVKSGSTALPSPAAPLPAKSEQRVPPYSADELDLFALHMSMVGRARSPRVLCTCVLHMSMASQPRGEMCVSASCAQALTRDATCRSRSSSCAGLLRSYHQSSKSSSKRAGCVTCALRCSHSFQYVRA
jgi:hypothetical protein